MSLTGYRTLVILQALIESPKTNDEINDYLFNNQYIKEKFSNDTLRIYINSLRTIGCEIIAANKSNSKKYVLISHPFAYDIEQSQLKALCKLYKNICDKIEIRDIIAIENLIKKISNLVQNEETRETLKSLSLLKYMDRDILNDLMAYCANKNQITFLYNSPQSGEKSIEIIADKLSCKAEKASEKIYLWGSNLTHKEYSYFAVDRILKISSIKISKNQDDLSLIQSPIRVVYELYNRDSDYILESDEKIIEKTDDKIVVEAISQNEFSLMQRILYMAGDCKVLEPEDFRVKLLNKLKNMEKVYETV